MEKLPYKHVQTLMPVEEVDELDRHIEKLKAKDPEVSKRGWIRETLLKEVRGGEPTNDTTKSLPLH